MLTRKRPLPSPNPNNDEDELSPSKSISAPLSSVKKRKLNTYGKNTRTSFLGKIGAVFGIGQSAREKEITARQKDELAQDEENEEEDVQKDIWEVPDEDEHFVRKPELKRTSTSTPKGTMNSLRRVGGAKSPIQDESAKRKKDINEVDDSAEDVSIDSIARRKSTSKKEIEDSTPKPKRGRPRKKVETPDPGPQSDSTPLRAAMTKEPGAEAASPKSPTGRQRKSDILKRAKALSREAVFHQMMEAGKKAAEEDTEEADNTKRRRSGRATQLDENDLHEMEDVETVATTAARVKGRPRGDAVDEVKEGPKGILTPKKNRSLKSTKSVAFEAQDGIDLGFKDLPVSAKSSKPNDLAQQRKEPSTATTSTKKKTNDSTEEILNSEEESENSDEERCAVCQGLDSKKGNEMILCENCDFAVHLKCYGLPKIPRGEWVCRVCQPINEDFLDLQADDDAALSEVAEKLPEIEGLEDHLQHMQRILLDKLTGQKRIKYRGHDEEMRKVHQVVEQTVLAGEGNSMLVIGARGCGKTTLVESIISDLSTDHREEFHVVRLNGFIHTDDKLALKEIWRQLGREMDAEDEMNGKANHADTLASLLALLSHPSEISEDRADETAKSVVFVLDEFDLFTTHPRQTLLYNLFDIAQARKAPIVVLGLTTRIDVVETLEKRVKSRFSHRYVHLSLAKSIPAFWEICKEALLVEKEQLEDGVLGQDKFATFWESMIDDLYNNDAAFKNHLQSHFYRAKSIPAFFTSCIMPIANLSSRTLPLTGRRFISSGISLSAPDSKLHILQGLSEIELALLIAAARLDIILDTDTCNFAMAYDEYSSLTSRHKIQTSSAGVNALGASAKVWGRDVALGAWERLAEYNLLVPAGIGGGTARDFGAGGRMWKVDIGLEEITGSVASLSGVMAKWCREI